MVRVYIFGEYHFYPYPKNKPMAALTIPEVFGSSASVTAGVLSISLADFTAIGLTGATPTASEIFTAIMLRLVSQQTTGSIDDVLVGVYIGEPFISVVRTNTQLERQFPVSVFTPFSSSTLDPDDVVG